MTTSRHIEPAHTTFRREALGAFAHELRTPLTAMRMILDMSKRTPTGAVELDAELSSLLESSLGELTGLADSLQAYSRLERGLLSPRPETMTLAEAVTAARARLERGTTLTSDGLADVTGFWDRANLSTAIAGLADGVNRLGTGTGEVALTTQLVPGSVVLSLTSGADHDGESTPLTTDGSFGFFAAHALLSLMGVTVTIDRKRQFCRATVTLPLG